MAGPLTLEKASKPMKIQLSSSTFLFTISLSLLSVSLFCLSSKDTTFWFLLSNSIIFFIVAESNASSKSNPDIYDEYLKHPRHRNTNSLAYIEIPQEQKVSETPHKNPIQEEKKKLETLIKDPTKEEKKELETSIKDPIKEENEDIEPPGEDPDEEDGNVEKTEEEKCSRDPNPDEESDFSAMSDEELNRRVEEFIQRFNRQIRLQEMREPNGNGVI